MIRRPPRSTRTDTLFPYTTLFPICTGMYSPWGPWGWSPYYGRYWGRSWYDPFWGPWGWDQPEVYSYTVYSSFLSMKIMRTGGGDRVFEGRAETQTRSDDLTSLVPNLVKRAEARRVGKELVSTCRSRWSSFH